MKIRIALLASFLPAMLAAGQNPRDDARRPPVVCASTADATPRGLAVVLPSNDRTPFSDIQAIDNPFMSGVVVQINWRDLEPAEGQLNWSRLDALVAAAEASGKWLRLSVIPGYFSPEWALQGAKTDTFQIQYGPGSGTPAQLAMPWDRVYLGRWFAFVKQIAVRYGNSPAFRAIGAAGPTSASDEMTLPLSREAVAKWIKGGYTPARYKSAWSEVFRVYADAFPNQCITITAPQLPILEGGRPNGPNGPRFMPEKHEVVERAVRAFGRRLTVQSNDLHAGRAAVEAFDGTDFINSYSGRIITGFEMRGGSQGAGPSKVMGAEGDPPLALRRSIDKGMRLNPSGHHVNYLEIYKGDVLPPDMQPVLKYAASLFR